MENQVNNVELVNALMPIMPLIIGIIFMVYATIETKMCCLNATHCCRNEPIFYLYLMFAAISFTIFGWMLHS